MKGVLALLVFCAYFVASWSLGTIDILASVKVGDGFDSISKLTEFNGTFYANFYAYPNYELQRFDKNWKQLRGSFSENIENIAIIDSFYFNSSIVVLSNRTPDPGETFIITINLADYSIIKNFTIPHTKYVFGEFLPLNLPPNCVGGHFTDSDNTSDASYVLSINVISGELTVLATFDELYEPEIYATLDPTNPSSPGIVMGFTITSQYFTLLAYDLSNGKQISSLKIPYNLWLHYQVVAPGVVAWFSQPNQLVFYQVVSGKLSQVEINGVLTPQRVVLLSPLNGIVYLVSTDPLSSELWMVQFNSTTNEGQLVAQGAVQLTFVNDLVAFEGNNIRVASQNLPSGIFALVGPTNS